MLLKNKSTLLKIRKKHKILIFWLPNKISTKKILFKKNEESLIKMSGELE